MHVVSRLLLSLVSCAVASAALAAAGSAPAPAGLTVAQIAAKYEAARGGVQAWRSLQTLTMAGKMDAGSGDSIARSRRAARGATTPSSKQQQIKTAKAGEKAAADVQVQLPFRLELKPPHKSRLEIDFAGNTAVQVFNGEEGWKLRPFLNRNDVEAFTPDEVKSAETGLSEMKGPLFDYAVNGSKAELEGNEPVEGHTAYKLKITMASGVVRHVWIDSQSFLDVKVEGMPRRMDGRMRNVWVYQRDFRTVQGIKMPYIYETAVEGSAQTHKVMVETLAVNRPLDDARFTKPQASLIKAPAAANKTN